MLCESLLGAVQVILKQLDLIEDQTTVKTLHKKMAPPLVTLLSAENEIQYVALRNINLIVQKNPGILAHEVKVCWQFFGKLKAAQASYPPLLAISLSAAPGDLHFLLHHFAYCLWKCCSWATILC